MSIFVAVRSLANVIVSPADATLWLLIHFGAAITPRFYSERDCFAAARRLSKRDMTRTVCVSPDQYEAVEFVGGVMVNPDLEIDMSMERVP